MTKPAAMPRLALYHPWPRYGWALPTNWLKTMLLFFDGIAILGPPSALDQVSPRDISTVEPLIDLGLLRMFDPTGLVDGESARLIQEYLLEVATTYPPPHSALDVPKQPSSLVDWGVVFPLRTGMMRLKQRNDALEMLWDELARKGLSVGPTKLRPRLLHPWIWPTVEAVFAYAARSAGLRAGLDLSPATDDPEHLDRTMSLLDRSLRPSGAQVVSSDLHEVALDLSRVPLEDVLAFREQHGAQYRAYAERLRLFVVELGVQSPLEQQSLLADRHAELADAAEDLRRAARRWWRIPMATLCFGVAGAAWTSGSDGWAPTLLALVGGGLAMAQAQPSPHTAYSYLLTARSHLGRPS